MPQPVSDPISPGRISLWGPETSRPVWRASPIAVAPTEACRLTHMTSYKIYTPQCTCMYRHTQARGHTLRNVLMGAHTPEAMGLGTGSRLKRVLSWRWGDG